jgi:multiple sugar transport system ATP-binding protein
VKSGDCGIELSDVTKYYGEVMAVDDLSLNIGSGEFVTVVGSSGSGKSTVLRMVAGLEAVTSGKIAIGAVDVTRMPPAQRDIAMVFQSYALFPHMTVWHNIAFGLRLRRRPKDEIRSEVRAVAAMLGLEDLLERKPAALSGGQRQRVAMGRALVRHPRAFLLDEPLSNLDAMLRVDMRAELAQLHRRLGVTTLYVTHDQVEAMTLGTRVAVMQEGVLRQYSPPEELYERPVDTFVASFIGSPSMNLTRATVMNGAVRLGGLVVKLPTRSPLLAFDGGEIIVGLRPGAIGLAGPGSDPALPTVNTQVELVESLGDECRLRLAAGVERVSPHLDAGAPDRDKPGGAMATTLTARCQGRVRLEPGDHAQFTIDARALYAFDAKTGLLLAHPMAAEAGSAAPGNHAVAR